MNEQSSAFAHDVRGNEIIEEEWDVVCRESDVGGANGNVINVGFGGRAIEVEVNAGRGVAGIAGAVSEERSLTTAAKETRMSAAIASLSVGSFSTEGNSWKMLWKGIGRGDPVLWSTP